MEQTQDPEGTADYWAAHNLPVDFVDDDITRSFLGLVEKWAEEGVVVWDGGCGYLKLSLFTYFQLVKRGIQPKVMLGFDVSISSIERGKLVAEALGVDRKVAAVPASVSQIPEILTQFNGTRKVVLLKDLVATLSPSVLRQMLPDLQNSLKSGELVILNFPVPGSDYHAVWKEGASLGYIKEKPVSMATGGVLGRIFEDPKGVYTTRAFYDEARFEGALQRHGFDVVDRTDALELPGTGPDEVPTRENHKVLVAQKR